MTEEWLHWLDRRDLSRPFCGFLYYDAAVAVEPPDNYPSPEPVPAGASKQARKYARYLSACALRRRGWWAVLDDLERRKLLERTVVIVTSDHGRSSTRTG